MIFSHYSAYCFFDLKIFNSYIWFIFLVLHLVIIRWCNDLLFLNLFLSFWSNTRILFNYRYTLMGDRQGKLVRLCTTDIIECWQEVCVAQAIERFGCYSEKYNTGWCHLINNNNPYYSSYNFLSRKIMRDVSK